MPLTHSVPGRAVPCSRLGARSLPQVRALRLSGLPDQLQLGGQGEGVQVVSLDDSAPRPLPDGAIRPRIGQRVHDGIGDRCGIEEVHQQSVFPVAQDLLHGRRPGTQYQASCRERFEHGPGEYEGVGEIDVDAGDLEHGEEGGVRHSAQEVHAAEVEGVPELFQHFLPVRLTFRQSHPIAHLITADDNHLSLGASGENRWEASHEAPESAVGLEIARDVGDDLILGRQLAITIRETEFGGRVGLYDPRVDTFVDDAQHGLISLGVKGLLPACRALANVSCLEAQEIADVLGAKPRCGVELLGDTGLEFDVCAFYPVEELEVSDQRNLRVDVLQVPDLSPAVVAQHDVGHKAHLLERKGGACDLLAVQHAGLCFAEVMVRLLGGLALRCVDDFPDSGQRAVLALGNKPYLIAALCGKVTREMKVLAREILMYEKYLHIPNAARTCGCVTCGSLAGARCE